MGCYQTLIPYIFIGNCNSELIFGMRASLRILYKNMTSYPIISKKYIFVTSSLRYSIQISLHRVILISMASKMAEVDQGTLTGVSHVCHCISQTCEFPDTNRENCLAMRSVFSHVFKLSRNEQNIQTKIK